MATTQDDMIAELQRANAELRRERDTALEQQTATAEVLQVINANPGNLRPVFDVILEKAHALCGADRGELLTFDGEFFQAVASHGLPEQFTSITHKPFRPAPRHQPLLNGERFAHTTNFRTMGAENHDDIGRGFAELTSIRAILAMPLRKDGVLLGFISAHRLEARPFSDSEIALLENFAAQAVIAMENARLIDEQREALEQQTATAEVLGVINRSPGDLTPVFDIILEKAMTLCGVAFGMLDTWDSQRWEIVATRGLPPALAEYLALDRDTRQTRPLFQQILETRRPAHRLDTRSGDAYRSGHASVQALADLGGARTFLVIPLLKDDTVTGTISVYRQEVRAFSGREIALLENFAAQAVIAMENARLLSEQREALEQQTATAEVLQVINASPGDLAPVFDALLEKAMRLCEAAFGELHTFDGEHFKPAALLGVPAAYAEARMITPLGGAPGTIGARILEGEDVLHILDLKEGESYRSGNIPRRAMVDLGGARTALVVALRKDDLLLGDIIIYRQEVRPFSDRQVALLKNFAAQAVIAMDNARLLGELRTALDTAQTTLRELKIAQANLIQAEKMASLGQLTAGIAHEIKNPLNFVNNFAALAIDLLKEFMVAAAPGIATLNEDQRADIDDILAMLISNLRKIEEHGKRADGIVKAMLEHSHGASGERRETDLNGLVEEALNLAYHGARARDQSFNITLERDFGEGIAPVELNPQDISRVFLNIISNGFYAVNARAKTDTGHEPRLTVTTRDAGDSVEIRIRDNGTGIPGDIRDKLFQPFFTTKPPGEGTGLGLSLTYDIVTKAHGGTIAVDSEVGEYTEFVVTLPRQMFARTEGRA